MKSSSIFLMIALVGIFLFAGCEKDTNSPGIDNEVAQQAVMDELEQSDYLIDWGIDDGNENNMFNGFSSFSPDISLPKILTPINNVARYGRKINQRNRRQIEIIRVSDDTLFYRVRRLLVGRFVIFDKINSGQGSDTVAIHRKPLQHEVERKAIFVRRQNSSEVDHNPRRRWQLAAVSLSQGFSSPERTVEIHEISVNTQSGQTYVFTDPLDTWLNIPDDLPAFVRGEEVTVTVLVSNSSDSLIANPETGATETVLLHFGINKRHHARKEFNCIGVDPTTGFNIYQGSWVVREPVARPFHAVVDVIDNGTIYDTDEVTFPYNSMTWGAPYRVIRQNP